MKYLLDTHTWIWWNTRSERLSKKVSSLIAASKNYEELLLSAISCWEFSKLVEKGRFRISVSGEKWIAEALDMANLCLVPLTPEIAWQSTVLPGSFHDDPGDQIIVATARQENAAIITTDKLILNYEHVQSVW